MNDEKHTNSATWRLSPVDFANVTFRDTFWAPRQETNRRVTIPHMYEKLVETDRIRAFTLDFERERTGASHADFRRFRCC